MATHYYDPAGRCIYCGETKLPPGASAFGEEHIVPYALAGHWVLPDASCKKCERTINREIETPVNSQEWGYFRTKYDLPSRNKKLRITSIKLPTKSGGFMHMPISEYPAPVPLYLFQQARILSGFQQKDNTNWTINLLTDGAKEVAAQQKYPEWHGHRFKMQPYPWARLIAKIGHGFAVAEYGISGFTPLATEIILGTSDDYFFLVGCDPINPIPPMQPGKDHDIEFQIKFIANGRALLIVFVRLFCANGTPRYHAVVGLIDTRNAEHIRIFEEHRAQGKIVVVPFAGA